jgi:hypothetical protein
MVYSDFDLKTAVHTFALTEIQDQDVFGEVSPLEPSDFLRIWLDKSAPVALGVIRSKPVKSTSSRPCWPEPNRALVEP